jgi:hypothetical protein
MLLTSYKKRGSSCKEAYRLYGYDGLMDLDGVNADSQAFASVLAISEDVSPSVMIPRIRDIEERVHLGISEIIMKVY